MNYIMMMIWNVSEIMFLDRDGDNAVIELLQGQERVHEQIRIDRRFNEINRQISEIS